MHQFNSKPARNATFHRSLFPAHGHAAPLGGPSEITPRSRGTRSPEDRLSQEPFLSSVASRRDALCGGRLDKRLPKGFGHFGDALKLALGLEDGLGH